MPARRELQFDNLDTAVADARHLLVSGYSRVGKWSLGQTCGHLAHYIKFPLTGKPALSKGLQITAFLLRHTVGPGLKRSMLATGKIPAGRPAIGNSVMPADTDDVAALTDYEIQIEALKRSTAGPYESPLFGPLTHDELVKLTCIHAAHHLSFLIPNDLLAAPQGRN